MGAMKLYELVNQYHIGTDLTCAEAMFKACNEYYNLNLSEETRKMFSVMGLGMQTEQSCCGAFTVAVGVIGLMTAKEGHTDIDNRVGYLMIAELTDFMLSFYSTLHCVELPVFVKLLFQKFPKKIVINYPAPGTSSRTLGYLCTKADQLIVPETCYHARTVQGGIPMTVTIADRLAFVRGVLF